MFAWMGRASYPKGDKVQERAAALIGPQRHHGTLHQAVGQTGKRLLHVRLGVVGKNIRDVPQRTYDVAALMEVMAGIGAEAGPK